MSNVSLYMIGVIIILGALGYGAHLAGVEPTWIGIGLAVVLGLGVMGAVTKTRRPEAPG